MVCKFNRQCLAAYSSSAITLNRSTFDQTNKSEYGSFTARVISNVGNNTLVMSSFINLTCTFDPSMSTLTVAYNISHADLVAEVANLNCTGESLNTTNIENRNIAEAKPFLKVLYISTQLVIYMVTAFFFGFFAQLQKVRANLHISSLPRSGSQLTERGWKEVSNNNSKMLKCIVTGSLQQAELDPVLRAQLRCSDHSRKIERLGYSAQGFSFRQQVADSHLKLKTILCQITNPKRPGLYLRDDLVSAVDTLRQDGQDDSSRFDLSIHINSYMLYWEKATFAESEFTKEEWEAFRSVYSELCQQLSQLVDAKIKLKEKKIKWKFLIMK